jgi:hypothetical protein
MIYLACLGVAVLLFGAAWLFTDSPGAPGLKLSDIDSSGVGWLLAWGFGGIAFLASWIYCMFQYGYLMGFGVGVIPSALLGGIVWLIMRYAWKPALGLGAIVLVVVFTR